MIQLTILIPFPVSFSICSSITNLGLLSFFILYLFHRFLPCFNSSVYLQFSLKSLVLLLHERYHRPPSSKLLVSQEHTHKHKHDLPDDAWVEVLCRLSLKNMIRCKSVSKSWNILISHLCIPKIRPPSLHGLYFITCLKSKREITLTWDFACIDETMKNTNLFSPLSCFSNLPFPFFPTEVLHCSNGFLLIRDVLSKHLYVCNPLTKQLFSLPISPEGSDPSSTSLMFDPHLSVVNISRQPLRMIIYSSTTREWMEHRGLHLEEPILKANWTSRHVSVDGCLYCLSLSGHLLEFDVKRVTSRAFKLPKIVQKKYGSNASLDCIGLSNGNLDYGWKDQDMSQIKVWTLHDGKWLPKHTISLLPFIIIFEGCDMLAPIAFHPTSDVLFLGHKKGIYGYHPDDQTLECFYEAKRGTYIDNYITFPFSWNVDTLQELVEPVTKNQSVGG